MNPALRHASDRMVKLHEFQAIGQFEFLLEGRGFSRAVTVPESVAALFSRCRDALFELTHYPVST
jgi:hypothetical protein